MAGPDTSPANNHWTPTCIIFGPDRGVYSPSPYGLGHFFFPFRRITWATSICMGRSFVVEIPPFLPVAFSLRARTFQGLRYTTGHRRDLKPCEQPPMYYPGRGTKSSFLLAWEEDGIYTVERRRDRERRARDAGNNEARAGTRVRFPVFQFSCDVERWSKEGDYCFSHRSILSNLSEGHLQVLHPHRGEEGGRRGRTG